MVLENQIIIARDILFDYPYFWLGVLFTLAGVAMFIHNALRFRYGYHTQGKVVKFFEKKSFANGRASTVYYPVVQFTDQDNTFREMEMEFGSNPAMYSQEESIHIIYYEDKVYPTEKVWQAFYVLSVAIGVGFITYQCLNGAT